jgi:hypothetical protein
VLLPVVALVTVGLPGAAALAGSAVTVPSTWVVSASVSQPMITIANARVSAAMPVVNSLFFIKTVLQKKELVKYIYGALRRKLAERTSLSSSTFPYGSW